MVAEPLLYRPKAAPELCDVLVIGGGPAGLMAAIESASTGARTTLVESEPSVGGSGALSAGHTVFCETDLCSGTREELRRDLDETHRGQHSEELVSLYLDDAPDTYRRTIDLGLPYARTIQLAHMSRPWVHEAQSGAGAALIAALESAARSTGVRILTDFRVRSLTQNESRRVNGARGQHNDHETEVRARAVVLASGGFTRSAELIRTFGPEKVQNIYPLTGAGSRGDGHLAAMALGAATSYMTMGILPTGPVDPTSGKATLIFYCGGVLLNKAGTRFYDESAGYTEITNAALDQPENLMVHIYDTTARDAYAQTQWAATDSLTGWTEVRGESLEELLTKLAASCGLDSDAAGKTLDKYNHDVTDDGYDTEFGRRNLVGHAGRLSTIENGPFFAVVTVPGTTNYNGGLTIDGRTQVLNVFGDKIDGLYAAGEIAGGFHGPGYMSGTQWGQSLIFGRRAGLEAGRLAREEASATA